MHSLTHQGWRDALQYVTVERRKPLLGICLGMQLLASRGEEGEPTDGLGFIDGTVRRLDSVGCALHGLTRGELVGRHVLDLVPPAERDSVAHNFSKLTTGEMVKMEGFKSGGNSVLVYFSCEDCAVEAGRVVGAGGRIHKEKFSIGQYGFIALAVDTEGNMFGMHSLK